MRLIDLKQRTRDPIRALVYGPSGAGKTHFAAGWPRPVFLADAVEQGWDTIVKMDPSAFYEPTIPPEVCAIENYDEALDQLKRIKDQIRQSPNTAPKSVVFDSLTFLSLSLEEALINKGFNPDADPWAFYRQIMNRLRALMVTAHQLPVNVLWICLQSPGDATTASGPLLSGRTRATLPAAVSLYLYMRVFQANPKLEPVYELRTRTYGNCPVRVRGRLPDPLPASFRALEKAYYAEPKSNGAPRPLVQPQPTRR